MPLLIIYLICINQPNFEDIIVEKFKRTLLITGATKGIGYATALRLHQQGHQVIGIARQESEFPGDLFLADLTDENETAETFNVIHKKYKVDGIVNNVGIALIQSLSEIKLDDFRNIIDLNLRPALQAMQFLCME